MLAMMHPMPSLFDAMLSDAMSDHPLVYRTAACHGLSQRARTATVNEKEKEYTITVSTPGLREEDLRVNIEDNYLSIEGQTKTAARTHFVNWASHLPSDADVERATASYVDGLLQVTIPKKEATTTAVALLANGESTPDEDDEHYYTMRLSCAGIAKADLNLVIEDGLLTISGETKSRGVHLPTRKYRLPDDAEGNKACASYIDGILTIAVPKKVVAIPKRIELVLNAETASEIIKEAEPAHDEAEKVKVNTEPMEAESMVDDEEPEIVEGAAASAGA